VFLYKKPPIPLPNGTKLKAQQIDVSAARWQISHYKQGIQLSLVGEVPRYKTRNLIKSVMTFE
jgi:hypothetical protein